MNNDMTSCRDCVQLLVDYAAAANRVIELKRHCDTPSVRLAHATAKQAHARQCLRQYQGNHPCDHPCPNNRRGNRKSNRTRAAQSRKTGVENRSATFTKG
jgi:hypothetical protein